MFKYCMSLGWYCGTACSMSRLGLRSARGPFDWIISDYHAALAHIENDFSDFMNSGNLVIVPDNPLAFVDNKYGYLFNHDVTKDFYFEIDGIVAKYQRRVQRFLEMCSEPSLFFRCVRDNSEIAYINENWEYADRVVKRFNDKNEIVYILLADMDELSIPTTYFRLPAGQYMTELPEMRYLFQQSEELSAFCKTVLNEDDFTENLSYDFNTNRKEAFFTFLERKLQQHPTELECIDKLLLGHSDPIYIWGSGRHGIMVAEYLKCKGCHLINVVESIDKGFIPGVPLIKPSDMGNDKAIFIAAASDHAIAEAAEKIKSQNKGNTIISFNDIYLDSEKLFDKSLLKSV